MRVRVLAVLLAFSLSAVVAFAWPLMIVSASERTRALAISRAADLDRFSTLARQPGDHSQLVSEVNRYTELYGEAVLVVDRLRHLVAASGGIRADDPAVVALIDGALRNEPAPGIPDLRPWSRTPVLLAAPVGDGTDVAGAVVLRASVRRAAADVTRSWSLATTGAVLAMAVCVLLALVVSRWVLRPLAELAGGLAAVTAGTRAAQVGGRAGPREVRALAAAFNRMSEAVEAAAGQQSRLIHDTSHQLRNPLGALRLRVDALAVAVQPEGERDYRSVVAELDRLERLLDGLLALANAENAVHRAIVRAQRGQDGGLSCSPAVVLTDRLDAWAIVAGQVPVQLTTGDVDTTATIRCPEGDLAQILDVLIDNAIRHTEPGTTVTLSCARRESMVRLAVCDNGPGLTAEQRALATTRFWRGDDSPFRGSGLGLAIVQELVTARSGHLALAAAAPTGLLVTLDLPAPQEP